MKIIKFLVAFLGFSFTLNSFAALDHFNVELWGDSVEFGNYTDLKISAMDENNQVIEDFTEEVIVLSDSDVNKVELPSSIEDNVYKFTPEDRGVATFENGVKFSSTWIQDITVYSVLDVEKIGTAEINVVEKTEKEPDSKTIEIISPISNSGIGDNFVTVNWTTEKNHNVKIVLNGTVEFKTLSNAEWAFDVKVENLKEGSNELVAYVLDADEKVIWESDKITFNSNSTLPVLDEIKVEPSEIFTDSEITFTVLANPELEEASLVFNDSIVKLVEDKENLWIYTAKIPAPAKGTYSVTVKLKDSFAHETTEDKKDIVIVKEKVVVPEPVKEEPVAEEPVKETVVEEPKGLETVKGMKVTKLKDKSIISWETQEAAEGYNVYKKDATTGERNLIETVSENKYAVYSVWDEDLYEEFSVKAVAKNEEWENMESPEFSQMVKVQTWPAEIALLLFLSMIIGYMIMRKRNAM